MRKGLCCLSKGPQRALAPLLALAGGGDLGRKGMGCLLGFRTEWHSRIQNRTSQHNTPQASMLFPPCTPLYPTHPEPMKPSKLQHQVLLKSHQTLTCLAICPGCSFRHHVCTNLAGRPMASAISAFSKPSSIRFGGPKHVFLRHGKV